MAKIRARGEDIRKFILSKVNDNPSQISSLTSKHFNITRQAVNRHLKKLVNESALSEHGNTKSRIYKLVPIFDWKNNYDIKSGLEEDLIWAKDILPRLGIMPDNVLKIWGYGFTEMFNNAIDHSNGSVIIVQIKKTAFSTEILIHDNGIGIFKKIQRELNLLDERHAIFELAKGKLTTDPKNHSGQGIFFTSRMFDSYAIISGGTYFSHEFDNPEDWLLEREAYNNGTSVIMELHNHTSRTIKKIFDKFSSGDSYGFNKTVVPIKLAQYGNDELISRSQAKRILARINLFKSVILDFKGVDSIGQAFADEIFRVFPIHNPSIHLTPINTNSEVRQMISRAIDKEIIK